MNQWIDLGCSGRHVRNPPKHSPNITDYVSHTTLQH